MYLTQAPNDVVALDAATGASSGLYRIRRPPQTRVCCGAVNRGLAILGDTLFMGTIDAHLVALDAKTGQPLWNVQVAEPALGYRVTHAPLVVKDKVIIGTAGGEYGIRGFIAAYDAKTGKEAWRFYTIPGPGEPGHETWAGDSWQHGGASVWVTGSYDPELNLTYWGIGNPGPDWNPDKRARRQSLQRFRRRARCRYRQAEMAFPVHAARRLGLRLRAGTGAGGHGHGRAVRAKLMLWANRNGFFYVLDRATGKFLLGKPFVKQTWARGLDEAGRPIKAPEHGAEHGRHAGLSRACRAARTGIRRRSARAPGCSTFRAGTITTASYRKLDGDYEPGRRYTGGSPRSPVPPIRRGPVKTWGDEAGYGAVRALDPRTGDLKWEFKMSDVTDSGILTTASDLLFTGGREGYFYALDARNGALLWKATVGGQVAAGPITYSVHGRQYVAIAAGHSLFVFALPAP